LTSQSFLTRNLSPAQQLLQQVKRASSTVSSEQRLTRAYHKVAPKPAPKEYEAPEIELETFEKPGLVPDLDAIGAALYIGDTTRALTLAIMALT
jgi:hypothetical protein